MLDVARGAEEALRRVEGAGVDTTGEDPAARRRGEVVGTPEAGDRVEQHHDVVAELDQALGPLDRELGDGGVVGRRTVEGRGDDLTLDRALHVRDLLGALVHQDDHEVRLGVVHGDGVGDRLQDQRLAGLGRAHDQTALPLADRGDEVDQTGREDVLLGLEPQPLLGVQRRELAELDPAAGVLGRLAVDRVQAHQRVELLAGRRLLALGEGLDGAGDGVALAQAVLLDDAERDVDVVLAGQVAAGPHEGVVVEHVQDARHGDQDVVVVDGLDLLGAAAVAAAAVAVTVAARATTLAVTGPLAVAPATAALVVVPVVAAASAVVAVVVARAAVAAVVVPVVRAVVAAVVRAVLAAVVVPVVRAVAAVVGAVATVVRAALAPVVGAVATVVRAALAAVSERLSPRLSPRFSPRLSERFSPRLSPRFSPWFSPRLSPRFSPWFSCGAEVTSWPGAVARDSRTSVAGAPVSCGAPASAEPAGRPARREVRAGRPLDTRAGTSCTGAGDAGLVAVSAAVPVDAGAGAVATGAPDWRARIAVTRSPLRILAVPLRPRLLASPWKPSEAHGGESATAAG